MMGNFEVVQVSAVESSTCDLHQDLPKTLEKPIAVVKDRFVYVLCTWLCTRITGLLVKGRCPAGVQDKKQAQFCMVSVVMSFAPFSPRKWIGNLVPVTHHHSQDVVGFVEAPNSQVSDISPPKTSR